MRFPHTGSIERMTQSGTKFVYSPNGTTECFLQPIDAESAQLYGLTFAKGSVCYLPIGADIKEADRVTINGNTYGVRGVKAHNYGSLKHQKATLELI